MPTAYFKFFRLRPVKRVKRRVTAASKRYLAHKEQARFIVHEKLTYFNQFYNFEYKKVAIRNQRSRWGSCSKRGNLNFNYKIVFLKPEQQDYIIIHELCHLKEFNHGPNFWELVKEQCPNFREIRSSVKTINV